MGFQFGSFNSICETAALVICPLVGTDQGIEPKCYSRNVDVGGKLLFQPCTLLSTVFISIWNPFVPGSNMLRTHRGHYHDGHYDPTYPKQIYCRRPQRNRHVFLDLRCHWTPCNVPRLGRHPFWECNISSEYPSPWISRPSLLCDIIVVCGDLYRPCCCGILLFAH